ncbi:MAG TPA: TlpA disulfide reductase family protein [Polyangiaceae bacterium]|nr:TlpA disulfide reductase family protein [Polyangiaceae bacterium]
MGRSALRSYLVARSLATCALVFVAGCSGSGGASAPAANGKSQLSPPDFELSTTDGKSERLSDHLGKEVVLLDFWATFCEPCLAGMPHLDALYREHHGQGFTVLGISIDGPDSVAQVKTTVSKLGISFPILLDQETRVVALYNPKTSAPYSVLIGRDGRILKKQEGYTTGNAALLDQDVADALARTTP